MSLQPGTRLGNYEVLSGPPESSGVLPSLGDVLETARSASYPENDTWGRAFSDTKGLKASELDRTDSRKRRDENGET